MQSVNPASRSSSRSFPVPRRVESIVGADAIVAYHNQQAAQRPAGGAYYEASRQAHVTAITGKNTNRNAVNKTIFPTASKRTLHASAFFRTLPRQKRNANNQRTHSSRARRERGRRKEV